jgi:type IV secretory pathway TraG/TraD family ATPase VirD4
MFSELATELSALSRGWSGLALGYATVAVPMVTAMVKRRAPLGKLLASPLLAVPVTAAAAVGIGVVQPLLHGLGVVNGGLAQFAVGVGVSAAVGYVGGRLIARSPSSSASYRRGTLVVDREEVSQPEQDAHGSANVRSSVKARTRGRQNTLTLAGVRVPLEDETKHFKIIGTTGTGKSTAIRELLGGALARGDRAVFADPDGGYLKRFYDKGRGDVILNPFDARSARWDLYGEITNDYDIDQLARSLIPDQEGSERSWRAYARTFFSSVVRQTRDAGVRDLKELYHVLVIADTKELKTLLEGTPAQPFLDDHNMRMFDSIRSVTSSAVDSLQYMGQETGPSFSVRQWVQNGKGVLFIPYQAGQIAALRAPISAWMRLAIFETMNREEGGQPLWFTIDELDALGQIDGLKDALARLRKFNGRVALGFQSIAQVSGEYGRAAAQTIVENCGTSVILRCSSSERGGTSSFASQLIGQREVVRISESRSRPPLRLLSTVTRSEHLSIEPAVLDSEIEQLPDLRGFMKLASSPHWQRIVLAPPAATHNTEAVSQVRGVAKRLWEAFKEYNSRRDAESAPRERGKQGAQDDYER